MIKIDNIDSLCSDELMELAEALNTLRAYCKTKAMAIQDRLDGEIQDALDQEEQCERFYQSLPAWARW